MKFYKTDNEKSSMNVILNHMGKNVRVVKRRSRIITAVFHDLKKGRDDSGYRFKLHHSFPSLLSIHHTSQRIIQYPPPHSFPSRSRTIFFVNCEITVLPVVGVCSPPQPRDAAAPECASISLYVFLVKLFFF